jgi:hypothetical protein
MTEIVPPPPEPVSWLSSKKKFRKSVVQRPVWKWNQNNCGREKDAREQSGSLLARPSSLKKISF